MNIVRRIAKDTEVVRQKIWKPLNLPNLDMENELRTKRSY